MNDWLGELLKSLTQFGQGNTQLMDGAPQGGWGLDSQAMGSALDVGKINNAGLAASGSDAGVSPTSMKGIFGGTLDDGTSVNGWGSSALSAGQGLMSGYLGMKQYGLAKDQLEESKRQFNQNFETQQKLTNSRLKDRQKARVASNAGAYQSVGDYMKKNGV